MRQLNSLFQGGPKSADCKGCASASKTNNHIPSTEKGNKQNESYCSFSINNENKSNCSDRVAEKLTPSKRAKMTRDPVVSSEIPRKGRTFGKEIDTNDTDSFSILDTSQISIETKDTAISGLTLNDDHNSASDTVSDDATDLTSSISHNAILREQIDEFGKSTKYGYEHRTHGSSIVGAERSQRQDESSVSTPSKPSTVKESVTSYVPSTNSHHVHSSALHHMLPARYHCSTQYQKHRNVVTLTQSTIVPTKQSSTIKSTNPNSASVVKGRGPTVRATPIRLKPKIKSEEVQATNEGYASVAKLSAWLADDPTSTKKLKQLRRGANVIAKSRKFDKELVNVVVEQTGLPRGGVSRRRDAIEQSCLAEAYNDNDEENTDGLSSSHDTGKSNAKDWMRLGLPGSDVGISVSDKKKWLSGAFKKSSDEDAGSVFATKKAFTEIITSRDRNDDVSSRAKQLWRNKNSPMRDQPTSLRGASPSMQRCAKESEQVEANLRTMSSETTNTTITSTMSKDDSTTTLSTVPSTSSTKIYRVGGGKATLSRPVLGQSCSSNARTENNPVQLRTFETLEDENCAVDFRVAREILVQRSKSNGNPVDASKVQLRKAKFEMLEREARRKSSQSASTSLIMKTSWEEAGSTGTSVYVKKNYMKDIAPKKSFQELP